MRLSLAVAALLVATAADAAEIVVQLSVVTPPSVAGEIPDAVPPRFVLWDDGQVYVGGTSRLLTGKLSGSEAGRIEKQADRVRKIPGLGGALTFGPGDAVYRLRLKKGTEVLARGELNQAPAALKPLAALIDTLLAFDHASLRPYEPSSYRVSARETILSGGCRAWAFSVPLADVVASPRIVPAAAAASWPTGGQPASVCAREKTYAVTLEPLVTGAGR